MLDILHLNLSYTEIFRMLALEILEIQLYLFHLLIDVAIRDDGLGARDEFLFVVNAIEQDRQLGLKRDIVEPLFPLGIQ